MDNLDVSLIQTLGRTETGYLMVLIDSVCAAAIFYIAVSVTKSFGFGSFEELLQAAHRIGLLLVAVLFAWHAEDIAVNPDVHGLTLANFLLHLGFVTVTTISAVRLRRAVRNEEETARLLKAGNGGMLTGPFPLRH